MGRFKQVFVAAFAAMIAIVSGTAALGAVPAPAYHGYVIGPELEWPVAYDGNNGRVAVVQDLDAATSWIYTVEDGVQQLEPPPGAVVAQIHGINDHGLSVGHWFGEEYQLPAAYDASGVALPGYFPMMPTWTHASVADVNNAGRAIGWATELTGLLWWDDSFTVIWDERGEPSVLAEPVGVDELYGYSALLEDGSLIGSGFQNPGAARQEMVLFRRHLIDGVYSDPDFIAVNIPEDFPYEFIFPEPLIGDGFILCDANTGTPSWQSIPIVVWPEFHVLDTGDEFSESGFTITVNGQLIGGMFKTWVEGVGLKPSACLWDGPEGPAIDLNLITTGLPDGFRLTRVVSISDDGAIVCLGDQLRSAMLLPMWSADLNADRIVNGIDLGMLLARWGTVHGDLNGDNTTDGLDLGILLADWTL